MKLLPFLVAMVTLTSPGHTQGQDTPETVTSEPEINTEKDKLVRYILDHPDLEHQQDLLEILLSGESSVNKVVDLLPEKNKKEFLN